MVNDSLASVAYLNSVQIILDYIWMLHLFNRYSHTAQVIDNLLVLIGGVNLCHQSPGVAVINLLTGACAEYALSVCIC